MIDKRWLCMGIVSVLAALPVLAQESYPNRSIALIVNVAPGTGADIVARLIAPRLGDRLKQTVVVENKVGASGVIGTEFVTKSAPNGYTLMLMVNSHTMVPWLYKNLPYDPLTGPVRSPLAPDVPTYREFGHNFMDYSDGWYALAAPAKTPADIVARLNQEVRNVMAQQDLIEQLGKQGIVPAASAPEEIVAQIKSDLQQWGKVVAGAKITAD